MTEFAQALFAYDSAASRTDPSCANSLGGARTLSLLVLSEMAFVDQALAFEQVSRST
jgi:hypothetical protein